MGTRSLGQLTIDLIAKVGGWTAGLSQAERDVQRRTAGIKRSIGSLQGVLAGLGIAAGIKKIVDATAEAERAFALLENAVQASGGAAGFTATQLAAVASELQKVSTYDDEAIQGMQQLLLRFQSIKGDNFKRAQQDVLDLATALNTDLQSAALLVGKALENPAKGMTQLARSGVVLSETEKELIKDLVKTGDAAKAQQVLLDGLEKRYAGAAAAARNTLGGALIGLKNAFGDLLEGNASGGGIGGVTKAINDFAALLSSTAVKAAASDFIEGIFQIGNVAASSVGALVKLQGAIQELIPGSKTFSSEVNRLLGIIAEGYQRLSGSWDQADQIKKDIADVDAALRDSFFGTPAKHIGKTREELEKLRKELQADLSAERLDEVKVTAQRVGPAFQSPPSEDFDKLLENMNERIALFGKVGEAAKVAYQIESGALDEIASKEEQQLLLSAARNLDALEAAKKAADDDAAYRAEVDASYFEGLRQMEEESLAAGEEMAQQALESSTQYTDAELEVQREAMEERRRLEEQLQEDLQKSRARGFENAANGLNFLLGKHKAVAAAVFLFQKRHDIAAAFIDTRAAVMKTYAKLGYPWGIPAAAAVAALGAANIASMVSAAPGISSTGGAITSGGGTTLPNSQNDSTGDAQSRGVTPQTVYQFHYHGDVYGAQDFEDFVVDTLRSYSDERDGVVFRSNSRQAMEIRG